MFFISRFQTLFLSCAVLTLKTIVIYLYQEVTLQNIKFHFLIDDGRIGRKENQWKREERKWLIL